jgi:hypothetical protein
MTIIDKALILFQNGTVRLDPDYPGESVRRLPGDELAEETKLLMTLTG